MSGVAATSEPEVDQNEPVLSVKMLENLAGKLSSKALVRSLGIQLDIDIEIIEHHFEDNQQRIKDAASAMLLGWYRDISDKKTAYRILGEALIHKDVKLARYAKEVLDYPPQ